MSGVGGDSPARLRIDGRLRPASLDVLVSDRLVRLSPAGAEFYFLSVMLATLPTLTSALHSPPLTEAERRKRETGFFAEFLETNLGVMPLSVLKEARRKRTYFNHVLARAAVGSSYQPARRLWKRSRQGFYLLNPELQVRLRMTAGSDGEWVNAALLTDPVARAWLEH